MTDQLTFTVKPDHCPACHSEIDSYWPETGMRSEAVIYKCHLYLWRNKPDDWFVLESSPCRNAFAAAVSLRARIRELEALLNAEQTAGELEGDQHQHLSFEWPPNMRGLAR